MEGQLVFNGIFQVLDAALADFGLAFVPEDLAQPHLAKGQPGTPRWSALWPDYHLYYPTDAFLCAFALLVDALHHRG